MKTLAKNQRLKIHLSGPVSYRDFRKRAPGLETWVSFELMLSGKASACYVFCEVVRSCTVTEFCEIINRY